VDLLETVSLRANVPIENKVVIKGVFQKLVKVAFKNLYLAIT